MVTLNRIPSEGEWSQIATYLNQNFTNLSLALQTEDSIATPYKGKTLAVLADMQPSGSMCWDVAANYYGMKLGTVSSAANNTVTARNQSFINLSQSISLSGADYLLLCGGLNDLKGNANVGTFDYDRGLGGQLNSELVPAYRKTIEHLQTTYKNMQILLCTVRADTVARKVWIGYNEAIRKLACDYGCTLIDFAKCGANLINTDTYSESQIQKLLGAQIIKDM